MIFQKYIFPLLIVFGLLALSIFIIQLIARRSLKLKQHSKEPESKPAATEQYISQGKNFIFDAPKMLLVFTGIFICLVALAFAMVGLDRSAVKQKYAKKSDRISVIYETKQIYGIAHILDVYSRIVIPNLFKGPDPESIERNYILESIDIDLIVNPTDAYCNKEYVLRPAPSQKNNEITFVFGQKEKIEDIEKNQPKISYKTSKDRWKTILKEDFRIVRTAKMAQVIIKVPLPEDAYKEDGVFKFRFYYYMYGWKECSDYRAYMELEETDCGPPSIYTFDTREFLYNINKVNIRLLFENTLPYIRVKVFKEKEMTVIDDNNRTRAIMDSLNETTQGTNYALEIVEPQEPFIILFEQDVFDIESVSDEKILKLKSLPYIK